MGSFIFFLILSNVLKAHFSLFFIYSLESYFYFKRKWLFSYKSLGFLKNTSTHQPFDKIIRAESIESSFCFNNLSFLNIYFSFEYLSSIKIKTLCLWGVRAYLGLKWVTSLKYEGFWRVIFLKAVLFLQEYSESSMLHKQENKGEKSCKWEAELGKRFCLVHLHCSCITINNAKKVIQFLL